MLTLCPTCSLGACSFPPFLYFNINVGSPQAYIGFQRGLALTQEGEVYIWGVLGSPSSVSIPHPLPDLSGKNITHVCQCISSIHFLLLACIICPVPNPAFSAIARTKPPSLLSEPV